MNKSQIIYVACLATACTATVTTSQQQYVPRLTESAHIQQAHHTAPMTPFLSLRGFQLR